MAFATSNIKLGTAGSSWSLSGDWTAAAGDTSGTVSIGGARVYSCEFHNQDGDSGMQSKMETSVSTNTTTGLSTVTVNLSANAVTNGRFRITYN